MIWYSNVMFVNASPDSLKILYKFEDAPILDESTLSFEKGKLKNSSNRKVLFLSWYSWSQASQSLLIGHEMASRERALGRRWFLGMK